MPESEVDGRRAVVGHLPARLPPPRRHRRHRRRWSAGRARYRAPAARQVDGRRDAAVRRRRATSVDRQRRRA